MRAWLKIRNAYTGFAVFCSSTPENLTLTLSNWMSVILYSEFCLQCRMWIWMHCKTESLLWKVVCHRLLLNLLILSPDGMMKSVVGRSTSHLWKEFWEDTPFTMFFWKICSMWNCSIFGCSAVLCTDNILSIYESYFVLIC